MKNVLMYSKGAVSTFRDSTLFDIAGFLQLLKTALILDCMD